MSEEKYSKKISPIIGILDTLAQLSEFIVRGGAPPSNRAEALNDKVGEQTVDTVYPTDTQTWETGIRREPGGGWKIVEQYPNKDVAITGHAAWVAKLTAKPDMELVDMDIWGLHDE